MFTGFRHSIAGGNGVLVATQIQSPNFVHGFTGWRLGKDGSLEAHDVIIPEGSGGTVVTFGGTAPTAPHVGDVWYDVSNGLEASVCTSISPVTWTPYQIGTGAIGYGAVTPSNIASLTASLVGPTGTLNANPYLLGEDITGWTSNATIVATSTPPAGSPFRYALEFTPVYQDDIAVETDTGYGFPVTPGQQYLYDAWIWTQDTFVDVGFEEFAAGTFSAWNTLGVNVTPNTWNHVTQVFTAGPAATTAAPFWRNTGTATASYIAGLVCLPQVPGSLIAAGTVTAAQLAAGIVYAGIVDATVITGVTINGSTFNGTNWVEDSDGMFLYDPAPAAGNLIASVSDAASGPKGETIVKGVTAYVRNSLGAILSTVSLNQPAPAALGSTRTWAGLSINSYTSPGYGNGGIYGQVSAADAIVSLTSGSEAAADVASVITLSSQAESGVSGGMILLAAGRVYAQGTVTAAPGGTPETWHPMSLANGWTLNSGGFAQYKLMPDNTVMVRFGGLKPGTVANGTTLWAPPAGYAAGYGGLMSFPVAVSYTTAPAYGSTPEVVVSASGGMQCYNLSAGTIASIAGTFRYPLD